MAVENVEDQHDRDDLRGWTVATWHAKSFGAANWLDIPFNHVWSWLMIGKFEKIYIAFVQTHHSKVVEELGPFTENERYYNQSN